MSGRERIAWGVALLAVLTTVVSPVVWNWMRPRIDPVSRFEIVQPPLVFDPSPARDIAVTPDGSRIIYSAVIDGQTQLVAR